MYYLGGAFHCSVLVLIHFVCSDLFSNEYDCKDNPVYKTEPFMSEIFPWFPAIDKGVYYVDRDSLTGIQIHALDTPIVCVATADVKPTVFPAPLRPVNPPITSMSFNVYNNIWDTNYIYWYPFLPEDANLRARFSIDFLLKGNKPHRALKNMIKCMK